MSDFLKVSADSYTGQYIARLHDQELFKKSLGDLPHYAITVIALRSLTALKATLLTVRDAGLAISHGFVYLILPRKPTEINRQIVLRIYAQAKAHFLSLRALPKILLGMPFGYLPKIEMDINSNIKMTSTLVSAFWHHNLTQAEREQRINQLNNVLNEFLENGVGYLSNEALVKGIDEHYPGLNAYLVDSQTTLEQSLMLLAICGRLPHLVRQLAPLMLEQLNPPAQIESDFIPRSFLMSLLYYGEISLAQILVESGVDCQTPNNHHAIPIDLFILQKACAYWKGRRYSQEDVKFVRALFSKGVRFNRARYSSLQNIHTETDHMAVGMFAGNLIRAWENKLSSSGLEGIMHLEGWPISEESQQLFWDEFIPQIEQLQKEFVQQTAQELSLIPTYAGHPPPRTLDPMRDLGPEILSFL